MRKSDATVDKNKNEKGEDGKKNMEWEKLRKRRLD